MFAMLNPYRWLLAIGLVAALVLGFHTWKAHLISTADKAGYDRAQAEGKAAAEAQTARNRDLARAAELRYTVAAETRERVIVETITEVRHATAHLAACPVGPAAVGMLNAAAACARGDRSASCGPDWKVRDAR